MPGGEVKEGESGEEPRQQNEVAGCGEGDLKLKKDNDLNEDQDKLQAEKDPKQEVVWHTGVCKWFNPSKGWGFINLAASKAQVAHGQSESEPVGEKSAACDSELEEEMPSGDIFVHQSTISKEGFR